MSVSLGQFAAEGTGVDEQVFERAPGELVLVESEDGIAALVGAAHAVAQRELGARDVVAGAGIDSDASRPR